MRAIDPLSALRGLVLPGVRDRVQAREQAHVTLRELAQTLGVCHSTVSRWERGVIEPRGAGRILYAASLAELSAKTSAPSVAPDDALRPRGSCRDGSPGPTPV